MTHFLVLLFGSLAVCLTCTASPVCNGRIAGGRDTDIKEVPYTIALLEKSRHVCGGSIISEKFILTAAHCVNGASPKNVNIRAGSSMSESGGVVYKVKSIVLHPSYSDKTLDYDVAILELTDPIKFSEVARPIALPNVEPKGGENVTVSGWGFLGEGLGIPKVLQSVVVRVRSRKECQKFYSLYPNYSPRMICAGEPRKGACQGDSGGPAVYNKTVVGVVSWGVGRFAEDVPSVYANVANPEIRKFIKEVAKV